MSVPFARAPSGYLNRLAPDLRRAQLRRHLTLGIQLSQLHTPNLRPNYKVGTVLNERRRPKTRPRNPPP
jgi:hypothetical protein